MVHNILPTQERLHRILPSISSPACTLCSSNNVCNLEHALFLCTFNNGVGQWLLQVLNKQLDQVSPEKVILLDLDIKDKLQLPIIWLVSNTLSYIWNSRLEKKSPSIFTTRATLEANIMILRKTRFSSAASTIRTFISIPE